ncbi:hypothetical protein [Streptomyces sp. NPDC056948]|uniref:hypothetical protein n=1 Tax=Streptomyces sp. NPDC056948 TaxID=3345975 RepID=UPI00362A14A6
MTTAQPETQPHRTTRHRRVRAARKPAIGALAAAGLLAGAWYASAGAATAPALAVTSTAVSLPAAFPYLSAGYNNTREWTRTATAAAPDGTLRVAWPAADGIHVTPLTTAGKRAGADTVVKGAKEVGGLVAHNDGFALLTRVSDSNKWKETAAALVRYQNGKQTFRTKLTGTASKDTAPLLDGQLTWNGSKYGAYFVVHGAGGPADGHFGDKLAYVSAKGAELSGGWGWGCSHNEGIALHAEKSGAFTSLCFDDWRSGLFVSTGIGAPDNAPVVQREQCWAGYCGGTFPSRTGDLVRSATGRYATAFASRGAASAKKNPDDASGRGWTVTPKTGTHQVAVAFLKDRNSGPGKAIRLSETKGVEHVNVHLAPYGKDRLLLSWESVKNATCKDGTCTGTFAGTHLRLIDWNGKFQSAAKVVQDRITGDIAVSADGTLTWAYAPATPSYAKPLTGASPTSTTLKIARLKP